MLPKDAGLSLKFEYIYRAQVKRVLTNGLAKISVYGQHDELPSDQLPIAECALDLFAAGPSNGVASKLEEGMDVWVFFDGGNIDNPVIFARAINKSKWAELLPDEATDTINSNNALTIKNTQGDMTVKSEAGNITVQAGGKIIITSDGYVLIN